MERRLNSRGLPPQQHRQDADPICLSPIDSSTTSLLVVVAVEDGGSNKEDSLDDEWCDYRRAGILTVVETFHYY